MDMKLQKSCTKHSEQRALCGMKCLGNCLSGQMQLEFTKNNKKKMICAREDLQVGEGISPRGERMTGPS